ncbi:FAD-dependent oxidoreductase [Desulfallas sp. Bu1-1]|uniref:FAD-dependent oxidoreductase n=1 Tax=Desulfallas sp. Bu1-1 TaxID=2787620 RepID=UPI00189E13A7|nr:FAD-dependent oxidoreductase [Desulfallas sp. Bu1-1]MBF7083918.1 FAD-dependent oxidoreductase [Desulfallas sp. Bu1-1]
MTASGCKVKELQTLIQNFLSDREYCGICRRNFNHILTCLEAIRDGAASIDHLNKIYDLTNQIINFCQCHKGKVAAESVTGHLRGNESNFLVHIENNICPSAECPKLVPAPCQSACPAGIDIPNYIALVGMGKYQKALDLIKEDVPLPGSLGRICEHPCQKACRRALVDKPVSICALKRLAYDKSREANRPSPEPPQKKYNEKVAVIGAGPAGLSASYFLARRGYRVTIFEAMPEAGGMLAYGIPPYRLPREVLRDEIAGIQAMGVEIRLNSPITGENGIANLFNRGYAAVFIGTGAWKGSIPVPNPEGLENVLDGVTFLRTVNAGLMDEPGAKRDTLSGKKVVVVGGGNVAIDAARVSLRLGAREVRIVYRRTRGEMPALPEEIMDAEKEGIQFDFLVAPVGVGGENGIVKYIECIRNELSRPDTGGRRKPVPVQGSEFKMEADMVIFATGQQPDLSFLENGAADGKVDVQQNRIVVNPETMETSLPGVFAGGDAVTGPASAIKAMAAGKQAAAAIHAFLRGQKPAAGIKYPVKRKSIPPIPTSPREKSDQGRVDLHQLYRADKKSTFEEVMSGISEEQAVSEAKRCLRCDLCIACGNCVDVCRHQVGADAVKLGYLSGNRDTETDFTRTGERCIGCGTCAVNCPTGAITMEDNHGFREMRMCGGLMSRLELVYCEVCGNAFATERHLAYINKQLKDGLKRPGNNTCPECARKIWTQNVYGVRIC